MKLDEETRLKVQEDIGSLAKAIESLSIKYQDEPLVAEVQKAFLNLSVHVGKAVSIQLQ